jgi:hypothetical protein
LFSQNENSKLVHSHFSHILGSPSSRTKAINWQELGYVHHDLSELDAPFTEEEIATVVKEMPKERAPGPDGFIGMFYKKCWTVVKDDIVQAILSFYCHRIARLNLINEANIVLVPQVASQVLDFRPISQINSVIKIITKILGNRLAPHMNSLVSNA